MTRPYFVTQSALEQFIRSALAEDIGSGDYSTLATVSENQKGKGILKSKQDGVIAGVELAKEIFLHIDSSLQVKAIVKDGAIVNSSGIVLEVSGPIRSILMGERLVLNCLQRMSGIATHTNKLNKLIAHTKAKVMDTRKTTPNFRLAEKWAVWIGGGTNHRMGLFDMIMLKDNHIDVCGGVAEAIKKAHNYLKETQQPLDIEVEARTLHDVETILGIGGISVIMLDNMSVGMMKDAVSLINGKYRTEASGGITEDTIVDVAETGVDFISIGALTHTVKSLDLNLKLVPS
ncbi:MAG: carboxylating nicotinate-nucleotide diphosphorylase [Flammeovirgaceae bacterium]|nr:carboxylating nicotinate-nucleotide diphosphorylase [Flammeovirgaceae bacterium]